MILLFVAPKCVKLLICFIDATPGGPYPDCLPAYSFGCKYLNFSVSRAAKELAARRLLLNLRKEPESLGAYCDPASVQHKCMVDCISKELNLTTLKYQSIHDMIKAIGIDEDKL